MLYSVGEKRHLYKLIDGNLDGCGCGEGVCGWRNGPIKSQVVEVIPRSL